MTAATAIDRPIRDIASALRSGEVKATEIAEVVVDRQHRLEPDLHAYRTFDEAQTRRQAAVADAALAAGYDMGPLHGIPTSVKDLYGVTGYDVWAGTPRRLPESWEREGPVVTALRRGLGVVTGKTHTVEFAFGGLGLNPHWEVPRNPWDAERHRAPGGSSSGAGVSLWEGTAMLAFGSDTAGSVRVPACWTGTFGLKTSFGRWSLDGIVPLSPSLDTAGILTRSADDAAVAFSVLDPLVAPSGREFLQRVGHAEPGGFAVAVCDWMFEDCGPGVAETVQDAIRKLEAAGVKVRKLELPQVAEAYEVFRAGGLTGIEFAAFINGPMKEWRTSLDPNVLERFGKIEQVTAIEYLARKRRMTKLAADMRTAMTGVDMIVGPTVPITAPVVDEVKEGRDYVRANMATLRNTSVGNLLEMCGATLPVGLASDSLPIGLMLSAPLGEDEKVVAASLAFERVLGRPLDILGRPPRIPA